MKYFLQREGRSFGPYSFDDLKRYQSEGRIGPDDKIRAEDSERWVSQTEFFNPPPAAAPQIAPLPVFTPPAAPTPAPAPAPTPAANPFAGPTEANPVWSQPAAPAQNPFAPPGATPNPFGAPPAQGFGQATQNVGFGGAPPQNPGFGAPAPGGFAPSPAGSAGWPAPPDMQWWLVLIITAVCGFFGLYWFYTQMVFVKKLDPASKAMKMIFGGWALLFGGVLVGAILGAILGDSSLAVIPALLGVVCYLGGLVSVILGIFNMRASIERHYNTTENIGLKLSPVMTFFFNMYYFQYHFARIAEWKKTGRLA
jgi:hypothetical protein